MPRQAAGDSDVMLVDDRMRRQRLIGHTVGVSFVLWTVVLPQLRDASREDDNRCYNDTLMAVGEAFSLLRAKTTKELLKMHPGEEEECTVEAFKCGSMGLGLALTRCVTSVGDLFHRLALSPSVTSPLPFQIVYSHFPDNFTGIPADEAWLCQMASAVCCESGSAGFMKWFLLVASHQRAFGLAYFAVCRCDPCNTALPRAIADACGIEYDDPTLQQWWNTRAGFRAAHFRQIFPALAGEKGKAFLFARGVALLTDEFF
jgi:hypothetical protein